MNNVTKQMVRHFNHKHARLLQHLIVENNVKFGESSNLTSTAETISQTFESTTNNCFSTNQVLCIIAVTCFLNFAFIVLIMMCVQILGSTSGGEQDSSEEGALLKECDDETYSLCTESSKIRSSLPDNMLTRKEADRLLRSKRLRSDCECLPMSLSNDYFIHPTVSKTYHFAPTRSFHSDDESENDEYSKRDWVNDFDTYKSRRQFLDTDYKYFEYHT